MLLLMEEILSPVDMFKYPIVEKGFYASQVVVWDIFHQQ